MSRLIDQAAAGEDIVIARSGTPVAKLVPISPTFAQPAAHLINGKRVLGLLDGKFEVPDDFDDPLPDDIIALFEGR